nr:hypothetical protein [uncultured Bacteroides sp.]
MYELELILNSLQYKFKNSWEETRMLAYTTAQVNSSKKIKATDLMQFTWDEKIEEQIETITNEDKERIKQKSDEIIKELNNNING